MIDLFWTLQRFLFFPSSTTPIPPTTNFLLLANGADFLLLANGTDKLQLAGP